jgi:very-short-patch-repair endonuclease
MRYGLVPDELRHGPFTTRIAARCGVSRSALRGDEWRHLLRDVWVHKDVADTREMRLAAVELVLPEHAFLCGLTPAWTYGIDVQDRRGDLIWVGCRTGHRLRTRPGCMVREITVDDDDLQLIDGVWMTTPLRTVFDCGRWLSLVEGVVVADALTHARLVSVEQLQAYARCHRGLRGVRRLDQVVSLTEPDTESPMETRVRLVLVLGGLAKPKPQVVVMDRTGCFVARGDLGYEKERVIVEYDGAWHWEQRVADERRREAMRREGWEVIVVSAEDYYQYPERTVARVRNALALRRAA